MKEKITYSKCGDYYIPDLAVPDVKEYTIGKYGNLRKKFLKEHHNWYFNLLIINGTLFNHLSEIDELCKNCMESMISKMAQQEGVTEQLKAADQMEWVRSMNSIHNRAEEFILDEYVYGGFGK